MDSFLCICTNEKKMMHELTSHWALSRQHDAARPDMAAKERKPSDLCDHASLELYPVMHIVLFLQNILAAGKKGWRETIRNLDDGE